MTIYKAPQHIRVTTPTTIITIFCVNCIDGELTMFAALVNNYPRRVQVFYLVVQLSVQLTNVNHRPLVGFPQEFPALVRHCISPHKQPVIVSSLIMQKKNIKPLQLCRTLITKLHCPTAVSTCRSTVCKRWSKCSRKILGGVFCQRLGEVSIVLHEHRQNYCHQMPGFSLKMHQIQFR